MKIKMDKRISVESYAKNMGIDIKLAKQYQAARAKWMKRVREFSRKWNVEDSSYIPQDIRRIKPIAGTNINEYLESRIVTILSRSSVASKFLKNRMADFILNVVNYVSEKSGELDPFIFSEYLNKASTSEIVNIYKQIPKDIFTLFYQSNKTKSTGKKDDEFISESDNLDYNLDMAVSNLLKIQKEIR